MTEFNEKHRLAKIGQVARPIVKMAVMPSGTSK
jgi:hypothetical protein